MTAAARARRAARVIRSTPLLHRPALGALTWLRAQPMAMDALSRVLQENDVLAPVPLSTQPAALAAATPGGLPPERWPVVGVVTAHLGDGEGTAIRAVASQQVAHPVFRPVLVVSEGGVEAARATGCPMEVIPAHAATEAVLAQRIADLHEHYRALTVLDAEADGLPVHHLAALATLAARATR